MRRSRPTSARCGSRRCAAPRRSAASIRSAMPELFELEYWSLEQAKLASNKPKPLTGQVMLVTGGAGAIGAATAKLFADYGRPCRGRRSRRRQGGGSRQEGRQPVDRYRRRCHRSGLAGAPPSTRRSRSMAALDILVSNAGAAWEGMIGRARRRAAAQELRAQLLRAPECGAERRAHLPAAGHRRRAAVQHQQAGDQSRRQVRRLWPAEGRDAVPVAPVCAGIRHRSACAPTPSMPTASARAS